MQKLSKEQKEIQGTYEPSKEAMQPVEYDEYERVPSAPSDWPPKAQKVFTDRCYDLKAAGYLKRAFIPELRRYCFAIYTAEVAERMILDDGEEAFVAKGKWFHILESANKIINQFGPKFGFNPQGSSKIPKVVKEVKALSLLK